MDGNESKAQNKKLKKYIDYSKKWISENKLFMFILLFAFLIRVYFFLITKNQPIWWDAADYMSQAKYIGGKFSFGYYFDPRRPFLLPVFWGMLFRLGLGEVTIRLFQILFSLGTVFGTYLLGKELYNKEVGLISSFLMAVFWQNLFFTFRPMTEIPSLMFLIFAFYFFWKGYVKKQESLLVWFGVFMGLALLTRGGILMMGVVLFLFVLATSPFSFVKNKRLWAAFFIILLIMSPFLAFIYFQDHKNPVKRYLGIGEGRFNTSRPAWEGIKAYLNFFPFYLGYIFLIVFIFSLSSLANILVAPDLILKPKKQKISFKRSLFLLIWILFPFLFHAIKVPSIEPRYIITIFPAVFVLMGKWLAGFSIKLEKHFNQPSLKLIFILVILLTGSFFQLQQANKIIVLKKDSYLQVKQAGIWIKEHSGSKDKVITVSRPQITYYSERQVIGFPQNETQFRDLLKKEHPKYAIISVFESHPKWVYTYPQKHKDLLIPVKVYAQANRPLLVIYEVNQTNL